jgi:Xaa-Pro aminopeptidase
LIISGLGAQASAMPRAFQARLRAARLPKSAAMRHAPIAPELFLENRRRLRALLPPGALAIVQANDIPPTNGDGTSAMIPNSDLFYLTGVEQEESILVMMPDAHDEKRREILFLRETSELIAQWEGHKLTIDEAKERTGIRQVKWLSEWPVFFHLLMCEAQSVWLAANENPRADLTVDSRAARFARGCREKYPLHRYERLARLLHRLRLEKSEAEIALIRHAIEITKDGFERVARFVRPGVNECEVEAEFAHEFIRQRGRFAYGPIVASGKNACVLHYVTNDEPCQDGDLLLLDVAAAYANYNADLTRTLPVNGRFSKRQREVYDAVLRVLRGSIAGLTVGKLPSEWQKESEAAMQEELLGLGLLKRSDIRKQNPDKPALKKYYPHGLGHPLGLDVHDVSTTGAPFAPGWVMTVEPGIYIPDEGLGVRLENDVLVTEQGPVDLMAHIPIEAEEIESAMQRRK